jgi:tyrosine-protein phosphatase SIW14
MERTITQPTKMRRLSLTFAFLCCAAAVGSASAQARQLTPSAVPWIPAEKLRIEGVPNAGKVTEQLYRGAQPHVGSISRLKKMGITTIVDLRAEDAGMREQEKKEAERTGIHFVSIPVGGWANPTNDEIAQFLSLFQGHSQERVFVHCHFGQDRSGVFVAVYRMAIQKWPPEEAIKEMYYFGFNGFWHPGMMSFIRHFPARATSVPALATVGSPASPVSAISPN